ncbi:helix-turn-helix domain-containing protein [Streptomyces sp. NPDC002701]|uniref:helix-turn-helix domain-containing protein n=1 Tax=Streptomyces sp. NPDC002701 TaxID=3364661 RepID=UPI0036CC60C0
MGDEPGTAERLTDTLGALLDSRGRTASEVAAALGIHPRTARNRLRRFAALYGEKLDDPLFRLDARSAPGRCAVPCRPVRQVLCPASAPVPRQGPSPPAGPAPAPPGRAPGDGHRPGSPAARAVARPCDLAHPGDTHRARPVPPGVGAAGRRGVPASSPRRTRPHAPVRRPHTTARRPECARIRPHTSERDRRPAVRHRDEEATCRYAPHPAGHLCC